MPKLKLSEEETKNRTLVATILFKRAMLGYDYEFVAKSSGMCVRSYYNKIKRPEMFTLDELRRITKVLKFTDEEKAKFI